MSIEFYTGKPGGGKSYMGVVTVCKELLRSERYICTNLPLSVEALAMWLAEQHKADSEGIPTVREVAQARRELGRRLRILDDSEASEFWLHEPGRDFYKRKDVKIRDKMRNVPEFEDRAKRGCLYVIDEVHCYFGSRDFKETGQDATFFLSQHRKLRCDCVFITQHPDQVDIAFRRLAQEYLTLRNLSREPVMGFRIGSVFRWARSLNSPTSANARVFDSGFLKLDVTEYGKLYDTMGGVGIAGGVVATEEKRGRSLWWLALPAVLIIALVFYGPSMVAHAGSWGMGKLVGKVIKGNEESAAAVKAHYSHTNPPSVGAFGGVSASPAAAELVKPVKLESAGPGSRDAYLPERPSTNSVRVVGITSVTGRGDVFLLSDGRIVSASGGRVLGRGDDCIFLRGEGRIPFVPGL